MYVPAHTHRTEPQPSRSLWSFSLPHTGASWHRRWKHSSRYGRCTCPCAFWLRLDGLNLLFVWFLSVCWAHSAPLTPSETRVSNTRWGWGILEHVWVGGSCMTGGGSSSTFTAFINVQHSIWCGRMCSLDCLLCVLSNYSLGLSLALLTSTFNKTQLTQQQQALQPLFGLMTVHENHH